MSNLGVSSPGASVTVPVAITARNEERAISACLDSLLASITFHHNTSSKIELQLVVVLDRCTDATGDLARARPGVQVLECDGGLVEAQRTVVEAFAQAPFVILSDADIRIEPETLSELLQTMVEPGCQVAYPCKKPLPPQRQSLLAKALYSYNLNNGFQTRRHYFNGKLFAIRGWSVPSQEQLQPRLAQLPTDHFYAYHQGMRVDDIYLSRQALKSGTDAIRQARGLLWFRPPETWAGMYRTYRRMRMEIERLDVIFPETAPVHHRLGRRQTDPEAWLAATHSQRWLFRIFQAALSVCKAAYLLERFYFRHWAKHDCDPWRPIGETKRPIDRI